MTIRVAHYGDWVGKTTVVEGVTVEYVSENQPHHINYKRYTADYTKRADRPYKVGKRRFKTLANAIRAVFAAGYKPL